MKSILDWALLYHKHGWQVFPCVDKRPAIATWEFIREYRVKTEKIHEWFSDPIPGLQIALACGELSGVTVVDVDWIKDPETRRPIPELSVPPDLIADRLVGALSSRTGSGGRHVFLSFFATKNLTKAFHPQIDVKSEGGYVILPPSPHEFGVYSWMDEENWDQELTDAPTSLVIACREHGERVKDWSKVMKGINEGARNTSASSVAGKLIGAFRGHLGVAWEMLVAWNAKNTPPLGEGELQTVFTNILKTDYAKHARFYQRNVE